MSEIDDRLLEILDNSKSNISIEGYVKNILGYAFVIGSIATFVNYILIGGGSLAIPIILLVNLLALFMILRYTFKQINQLFTDRVIEIKNTIKNDVDEIE